MVNKKKFDPEDPFPVDDFYMYEIDLCFPKDYKRKAMTKKQIVDYEQQNERFIMLHQEGAFWVAYEKSAFRFAKAVRPYKAKRKEIKSLGVEMASLGFPLKAIDGVIEDIGGRRYLQLINDKRVVFLPDNAKMPDNSEFEEWKEGLEKYERKAKKSTKNETTTTRNENVNVNENADEEKSIEEKILNFCVESATPIECMNFVAQLRRQVTNAMRT